MNKVARILVGVCLCLATLMLPAAQAENKITATNTNDSGPGSSDPSGRSVVDPSIYEIVKKFAPVLKFDRAHKGLPMSAQNYFDTMMMMTTDSARRTVTWTTPRNGRCGKQGVVLVPGRDENNCGMQNNDFQSLREGRVPTYYRVISDEEGRLRIAYWWYYGFQQYCNPLSCFQQSAGEHHGDWEHIYVTTSPPGRDGGRSIDYVTYTFHGQWYTRARSQFEIDEEGRPVVYVGKLAHGSYHDQTLSGWMANTPHHCCEYADFRNAVPETVWANTADNLVSLDDNSEPWMLADRIGSLYEYEGKQLEIEHWRWGPHISYQGGVWPFCKWYHVDASGTHPTVATFDWCMPSCKGAQGCGATHCKGLVYDRDAHFNSPWQWANDGSGFYTNKYDESVEFLCSDTQALTKIHSCHNDYTEDRIWRFGCSPMSVSDPKCDWTAELNTMDLPLDYQASGHSYFVGLYSYHSNYTEDRVWKARWCEAKGQCRSNCKWTGYVNDWDGALTLSTGSQIIAGIRSEHDNNKEDRRWEFWLCDLTPCNKEDDVPPSPPPPVSLRTDTR